MMIEGFLRYITAELGLSALTSRAYGTDLRQWVDYMRARVSQGEFTPLSYTTSQLRLWIAYLSREGHSVSSIHRKASTLKAFYRYLMRHHGLKANPASDLQLARQPKSLPVFIRPEETKALLDDSAEQSNATNRTNAYTECDDFVGLRNHLILTLLYSTGMRSSELLTLEDRAVDTRACELKVHGKRNKDRIIPFGKELQQMIDHYRRVRDYEVGPGAHELIVRPDGRPLSRRMLYTIVHTQLQGRVHAQRTSPHTLRHSFATDMLNAGASLTAVSSLLGHASLASTQVYTHITYRELKQNYSSAHPRAQKKGDPHGSKN